MARMFDSPLGYLLALLYVPATLWLVDQLHEPLIIYPAALLALIVWLATRWIERLEVRRAKSAATEQRRAVDRGELPGAARDWH